MNLRRLLILLTLLYYGPLIAQDSASFPLNLLEPKERKERTITNIIFQFDNRSERYYGEPAQMNGLRMGLEIKEKYRFGFGFYENRDFVPLRVPGTPDTLNRTISYRASTLFFEYVWFEDFRWELSSPLSYGPGTFRINNFRVGGNGQNVEPQFLRTDTLENIGNLDISLAGHYKIFPWFGVGVGVGYRQLLVSNGNLRDPFSSPYFVFRLKLFLGYAFKSITNPAAVKAEKEAYKEGRAQKRQQRKAKK